VVCSAPPQLPSRWRQIATNPRITGGRFQKPNRTLQTTTAAVPRRPQLAGRAPRGDVARRAPCACDRHATPGVRVPYLCASAGGCAPPTCGGSSPRAGGWRNKPRTAPEQTARGAGQPVHWTGGRIVHWTVCDDDVASPAAERRRTLPTSPPVRAPSPLGKPANFSQQTWLRWLGQGASSKRDHRSLDFAGTGGTEDIPASRRPLPPRETAECGRSSMCEHHQRIRMCAGISRGGV
jgi:hypothetical protein